MAQRISMRVMPALLLVAFSGAASASGFQLLEAGSGLGNAYAGSAAKANDASTIFWNPAGMTQLQAREVSGGLTAVRPSFKFNNKGSLSASSVVPSLATVTMPVAGRLSRTDISRGR
jgi:long-chain fatty acid transport protein